MIFDDDIPNKPKNQPKNLEPMSLSDLAEYIEDLKGEIVRAEAEIVRKKAVAEAAASFFKS